MPIRRILFLFVALLPTASATFGADLLPPLLSPGKWLSPAPPRGPLLVPGMTMTEVEAVLGPPDFIRTLRTRDAFLYCPRSLFGIALGSEYATIYFVDNRLVNFRLYKTREMGGCEPYVAAFNWTEADAAPEWVSRDLK